MANQRQQAGIRAFLLPLTINGAADNLVCLFSQNQVVEILGPRPVQQIPGSPAYLKGVLLYHDTLLPVIDLDHLCNRQPTSRRQGYRQLVVVRTGAADPMTGEPLKAVITASVRVQIAKMTGQELATGFTEGEAPAALRDTGLLRGYFQRRDDAVAVLDLGPVVQGTADRPEGAGL